MRQFTYVVKLVADTSWAVQIRGGSEDRILAECLGEGLKRSLQLDGRGDVDIVA